MIIKEWLKNWSWSEIWMGYEWNKEVIMMIYFDKIDKDGDMYKIIWSRYEIV